MKHPLTLFVVVLSLTSCSVWQKQPLARLTNNYCAPSIAYTYDSAYLPKPTALVLQRIDTSLINRYSRHDLLLANAAGLLPTLQELRVLEKSRQPGAQLAIIAKRQQIFNRLLLMASQISGFAAELDCEGEQADQIAAYLDERDTRRIRRLTILSVILGAATTVTTALIQASTPNKVIGISGGVISAGFGGLAAFSSNRSVNFTHQRNLLADIWYQPKQSALCPPMVWYVLNEKIFSNEGQYSISHNIRERWKNYVVRDASPEQIELYFGKGGRYQADDLHNRANMLNQLQSSIRQINQDLQSLVLSVSF